MLGFDDFIQIAMVEEGPMANDKFDPGGLTRFGIAQSKHPGIDVATLTFADAVGIIRREYWEKVRADELPSPLSIVVADAAFNQGQQTAIEMLQKEVGVLEDGIMGPVTLAAAAKASADLVPLYFARRCIEYSKDAVFPRYGRGWLARCFRLAARLARA